MGEPRVVSERRCSPEEYGARKILIIDGREITDPTEIASLEAKYKLSSKYKGVQSTKKYNQNMRSSYATTTMVDGKRLPDVLIVDGREITNPAEIARILAQYRQHETSTSTQSAGIMINGKRLPDKLIIEGREITDPSEIARLYIEFEHQSSHQTNSLRTSGYHHAGESCGLGLNSCCTSHCTKCGNRIAHLAEGSSYQTAQPIVRRSNYQEQALGSTGGNPFYSTSRSVSPVITPAKIQQPYSKMASVSQSQLINRPASGLRVEQPSGPKYSQGEFSSVTIISQRNENNELTKSRSPSPIRSSGYVGPAVQSSQTGTYSKFDSQPIKLTGSSSSSNLIKSNVGSSSYNTPIRMGASQTFTTGQLNYASSGQPLSSIGSAQPTSSYFGQRVHQPGQDLPPLDTAAIIREANESFARYSPKPSGQNFSSHTAFNKTSTVSSYGTSGVGYQVMRV